MVLMLAACSGDDSAPESDASGAQDAATQIEAGNAAVDAAQDDAGASPLVTVRTKDGAEPASTATGKMDAGSKMDASPTRGDAGNDASTPIMQDAALDASPDALVIHFPGEDASIAVPDEGFYVQLEWSTPNDPDELDHGAAVGADVDLHVTNDAANNGTYDGDGDGTPDGWFDTVNDCFWININPDWGQRNEPSDNPSLDRDDVDGAGPELIGLLVPQDGHRYTVGVHYWTDNGFGPSYATVRIYVRGALAATRPDVELHTRDLWEVATIDWPSGTVTPIEDAPGTPRIIPTYNHPAFTP